MFDRIKGYLYGAVLRQLAASAPADQRWTSRHRGWMQTFSGRKFYPLAPTADAVELVDVAHGLAMTCRYGGHARKFYSVAEHCVHVSRFVDPQYAREALFHDSAEAYIGDMIRPLKHQPEMLEFRRAEAGIEAVVFERFGIESTTTSHAAVKEVDDGILVDEINALLPDPAMYLRDDDTMRGIQPIGVRLECWSPEVAERRFLERYRELFQ